MNKSVLPLLLFFLAVLLIPTHAFSEINAPSRSIESMENSQDWQVLGDKASLETCPGVKGKGVMLNFTLSPTKTWTTLSKKVDNLVLSNNSIISFYVKGESADNNIEFKLIDARGNTFWQKLDNYHFSSTWEKIEIKKSDLVYAWGPDAGAKLSVVDKIEIGVSLGTPGTGKACFDEITLSRGKTEEIQTNSYILTASAQQDEFTPDKAMDQNIRTRWSSPFSDPQWIMIDMKKNEEIAGLVIYWETAFAESYDILVSQDSQKWETVYSIERSDGNSDIIYFKPKLARYIKVFCKVRATAWGDSILEMEIIKKNKFPLLTASSSPDSINNILDSDLNTIWTSDKKKEQNIIFDLKKEMRLGGLTINWAGTPPTQRTLYYSRNNKDWKALYSSKRKIKETEKIFFESVSASYLKLDMIRGDGPAQIRELQFKGQDEKASPEMTFKNAAKDAPEGCYPKWLAGLQEYWTVTGVENETRKSLLSEDGTVEPYHNSYSFSPLLKVNNKLVTFGDAVTAQSLEDKCLPLPRVVWEAKDLDLVIESFGADDGDKSSTYMKYTITNRSKAELKGEFYLLLRPFQVNPPWMHGGLSQIQSIQYDPTVSGMLKVNNQNALYIPSSPAQIAAVPYQRKDINQENVTGDIIEEIREGTLSSSKSIDLKDPSEYASACVSYSYQLKPGESKIYYFVAPLHDTIHQIRTDLKEDAFASWFNGQRSKMKKIWIDKLSVVKIELPDPEFVDTLKSSLAYIIINNDHIRLQPGSRNYDSAWMRDGALMSRALLTMNFTNEVKNYLNWTSKFVGKDGWVPFIINQKDEPVLNGWQEYDSQGEYIYAVYQCYLFTKNREFLASKKNNIINDISYMKNLRKKRMTPEYQDPAKKEFYGIFPESQSHEGYIDPPRHSYWDDFWALRGLKDAINTFSVLNDPAEKKNTEIELTDFRKAVLDSMTLVMKKKNIPHLPGCAELGDGDFTSIAIDLWPCGEFKYLPASIVTNTFKMYWKELSTRFEPDWKGGFTPYEIRNANPFIIMGQVDKLHVMITNFFTWKRPRAWNHWAEVVLPKYRMAQYLGDMPHTWISAEYVSVVRNMLLFEDEKTLTIGKGLPAEWFKPGDRISITDMPTEFGKISYTMESSPKSIKMKFSGNLKNQDAIFLKIPQISGIQSVSVNNKDNQKWKSSGEALIPSLPAEVIITRQ